MPLAGGAALGLDGAVPEESRTPFGLLERARSVPTADGLSLRLWSLTDPDREPELGAPAFLLIHGFAQNRRAWTLGELPTALIGLGARVFVGELRGHGASDLPEGGRRWSLWAHLELDLPALVDGVREEAAAPKVHLMGHSMGGMLGYALLARPAPLASLTTFAAPLALGATRPLVSLAAAVARPVFAAVLPPAVPMRQLLGGLSRVLSAPGARGPKRLLQKLTRLANPDLADPEHLRQILAGADQESREVLMELAAMARQPSARLADVVLADAVRAARIPVAAVTGTEDIFAPPASLSALLTGEHLGPRRVVEIMGGTHVDVTMGHHIPGTVRDLAPFLLGA